jgi:uncharacterized membrane protein YkoI
MKEMTIDRNYENNYQMDAIKVIPHQLTYQIQRGGIRMKNKTKILKGIALVLAIVVGAGGYLTAVPAGAIKMDINPSIEIVTNRLDRVIEINPLNLDAKKMLENFEPKDKSLEGTVNDLVDLMILAGYISGGKDNVVLLTVNDDTVDSELVERVNKAIAAMLQNKQIEARVIKQTLKDSLDDDLYEDDKDDERTVEPKEIITRADAEAIALARVNGEIIKLELDDKSDDGKPEYEIHIIADGVKHELEIDAFNGTITEHEMDDDDDDHDNKDDKKTDANSISESVRVDAANQQKQIIGVEGAKNIALSMVKGEIKSIELEDDDDDLEYKIEIVSEGREYEIELDAYTGKVLEFESDDLYDDWDDYDDDDDDDDDRDDD